jgi:hypothetical protein
VKLLAVLLGFSFVVACSSSDDDDKKAAATPTPGVGADAGPASCAPDIAPPETRQVSCAVTLATPGFQQPASKHEPEGTQITYCSNPPTSGPHYAVWADFKEYDKEVPWPYLVHSEEHGGVLLLYKCETPCPDVVEALRAVRDRAAADPTCQGQSRPDVKRIVIAPSTTIPTRVAAAAWGATYTADCVDGPTLDEFVKTKGQNGPENLCFAGRATF